MPIQFQRLPEQGFSRLLHQGGLEMQDFLEPQAIFRVAA
jgi:hypothetical protein